MNWAPRIKFAASCITEGFFLTDELPCAVEGKESTSRVAVRMILLRSHHTSTPTTYTLHHKNPFSTLRTRIIAVDLESLI